MKPWFRPVMRRALILAAIVAIVAIPMTVANIGFCRAMPCCPPNVGVHIADAHQPDCCSTTNCAQAPAAGREYTSAKQTDHHVPALLAVAVVPTVLTGQAHSSLGAVAPVEPQPLHRRIALLSLLLI